MGGILLVAGAIAVLGGLFLTQMILRTQVGLSYSDDSYGMMMDYNCGSKIEWVFGGGPSVPYSDTGMDTHDVRSLCHDKYDEDVGTWRAQFWGGIAAVVLGAGLAGVGMKVVEGKDGGGP